MKEISVIIPCYNVSLYIDRCITSIVEQTIGVERLEIICVDDASTDDTWVHLQKWERLFPDNILLIRHEVNRRQGAARNLGLSLASAEWVSYVDADDWLELDFFERLYRAAMKYACDVVVCEWIRDASGSLVYIDEGRRGNGKEEYIAVNTEEATKSLYRSRLLGPGVHAKIIRKSLLAEHEIFFPEGLTYEDMYWYPLLHVYAAGICIIREYLYHYFINPHATVMSRNELYHLDWFTVQLVKWEDYHRRGLFDQYREEMEYDVLNDAACFIKLLIFRYDVTPFSFFQLEREFIRSRIPDYKSNKYTSDFSELYQFFLKILYSSVSESEFAQITKQAKKNWKVS